jgi:hypothetical protein
MARTKTILGGLLVILLVVAVSAADYTCNMTTAAPTIDGVLNEAMWGTGDNTFTNEHMLANYTAPTDETDLLVKWSIRWDNAAFYLGVWFNDEAHNAIAAPYLTSSHEAYEDDGVEIFIDVSYDDAINDVTSGFRGDLGWQLIKGFGNADPSEQYAGMWGQEPDGFRLWENWDVTTQEAKGWYNVYKSDNGTDYQYEAKFTWAGEIMRAQGTPSANHDMALDLFINDNDDGFSAESKYVLNPPHTHQSATGSVEHWSKVTLSETGISIRAPRMVTMAKTASVKPTLTYDAFGRKIQGHILQGAAIRFDANRNVAQKHLVLR